FIVLVLLMTMMNFVSHGTQDMYPTFLKYNWNFGPRQRASINAFSMVGAIAGGIVFGFLSDRWGRRRSMILALLLALIVFPLWAFSPSLAFIIACALLIVFMVCGAVV